MARYAHEYRSGDRDAGRVPRRRPMGMDPNYRGGRYGGQRFDGGRDDAAYGRYRAQHGRELAAHGGARGAAAGAGMLRDPGPMRPSGPASPPEPASSLALRRPQHAGRARSAPYDRSLAARPRYDRAYRDQRRGGGPGPRPQRAGPPGRGFRSEGRGASGPDPRFDAARPLRYDAGLARYRSRRDRFSEGYLGSGF